jgi:uncharacterized protein
MDVTAALCGIAIGLVQGLIGGGGSVLGVPVLIYVVGLADPHIAIGTSALSVGLSALVSLMAYVRSRHVKWRCGAAFTATGAVGALAGSSLGMAFPGRELVGLFGGLMIVVALAMAIGPPIEGDAHVRLDRSSAMRLAPFLLLYGFGVGALSGFFGIGGGFLAVPGLFAATDMPLIFAIGTSLISVAFLALRPPSTTPSPASLTGASSVFSLPAVRWAESLERSSRASLQKNAARSRAPFPPSSRSSACS